MVTAHVLALEKLGQVGFGKYIISATSPFTKDHLLDLHRDAGLVVEKLYPHFRILFEQKGWKMFPTIDRVYINEKARRELGWRPKYDFDYVLNCLELNKDFHSQLSLVVGIKGYHDDIFSDGPYPVGHK